MAQPRQSPSSRPRTGPSNSDNDCDPGRRAAGGLTDGVLAGARQLHKVGFLPGASLGCSPRLEGHARRAQGRLRRARRALPAHDGRRDPAGAPARRRRLTAREASPAGAQQWQVSRATVNEKLPDDPRDVADAEPAPDARAPGTSGNTTTRKHAESGCPVRVEEPVTQRRWTLHSRDPTAGRARISGGPPACRSSASSMDLFWAPESSTNRRHQG